MTVPVMVSTQDMKLNISTAGSCMLTNIQNNEIITPPPQPHPYPNLPSKYPSILHHGGSNFATDLAIRSLGVASAFTRTPLAPSLYFRCGLAALHALHSEPFPGFPPL
jgi:hypothetical protein